MKMTISNTKKIQLTLTLAVMFSLWSFGTGSMLLAQQDGPPGAPPLPPGMQDSQQSGAPQPMSVKSRLSQMTQRYDLTASQQEAIRPILESEQKQVTELRSDISLAPPEIFTRIKVIHKDAGKKIEAVLTDTQKAKFENDEAEMEAQIQRMKEMMPPPGEGPPPQ